jgi:DNA polymerase-3 subunit gamma/tau
MAAPPVASDELPPWLDVPDEIESAPAAAPSEPDREPRPARAVAAPVPTVETTPLGDRWNEVVMQLVAAGSIGALVRELAMQAQCVGVEEVGATQRWRLRAERETLRAPAQRDKLQAALGELLQRSVQIEVEAGVPVDSPARRAAAERARRQAEAEQIIHDDPLVQALMQQFKTARIVPGSVKPH